MARKVNWAYEAATDLEALAEYIARDSAFLCVSICSGNPRCKPFTQ